MPKLSVLACRQCLKIALVVGTILSLINQTPAILHLDFNGEVLIHKNCLTTEKGLDMTAKMVKSHFG